MMLIVVCTLWPAQDDRIYAEEKDRDEGVIHSSQKPAVSRDLADTGKGVEEKERQGFWREGVRNLVF